MQGALKLAARAAAAAGVPDAVSFHSGQCGDWRLSSASASEQHRIVVCNPPWGRRLLTGGADYLLP